jgi:predicted nuclease with RNAse H fold
MFVGLDLAWGSRDAARTPRPSGLAVVDRQGRLIQVRSVVTDGAITEAIAPHLEPRCVVAIDAPLKITNQDGNRLAEAQLNKVFNHSTPARIRPTRTGSRLIRAAHASHAHSNWTSTRIRMHPSAPSRSTRTRRPLRCSGSAGSSSTRADRSSSASSSSIDSWAQSRICIMPKSLSTSRGVLTGTGCGATWKRRPDQST